MNEHVDAIGLVGDPANDDAAYMPVSDAPQLPAGPRNLEAEMALLGAILINNEVYTAVADFLSPEHFWDPVNARVYATICDLVEQGQAVNAITIHHHFVDHEGVRQLGGMAYFARLAAACPAVVTAPDYARIIYELANRRRILDVAEKLHERASGSGVDRLDDIISETLDMIAHGSGLGDRIKRTRATAGETAALVIERINQAYMAGEAGIPKAMISTGSAELDRKLGGWRRKFYYVIAGRPGMGKSTCAMSWLLRTAKKGAGVLDFSLEMSREALIERCLSDLTYRTDRPIPYERISRGDVNANDIERLIEAEKTLRSLPLVIEEKAGLSVPQMRIIAQNVAQRMAEKGQRLDVILVDHMGKIKPSGTYKGNKVAEVGEVSGALAEMAKDLDVAVVALAQLSRQVEGREDKRPSLADLRWAGEIEQDIDVAMFLYREAYYLERNRSGSAAEKLERADRLAEVAHELEVDVAKQRGGAPGAVTLWADMACAAVRDMVPAGMIKEGLGL